MINAELAEIIASGQLDITKELINAPSGLSLDAPTAEQQAENMNEVDLTISLLEKVASTSDSDQRQQRELTLDEDGRDQLKKAFNADTFVQDVVPEEDSISSVEPAQEGEKVLDGTSNQYESIPTHIPTQPDNNAHKQMYEHQQGIMDSPAWLTKSGKLKKLEQSLGYKAKLELTGMGKEQQQQQLDDEKKTLKSSAKLKSEKEKNEQFMKASSNQDEMNEAEDQEQESSNNVPVIEKDNPQDFVAPTVIQRGFHPILPYSEKDPGLVLVPIGQQQQSSSGKMEKFIPPFGLPLPAMDPGRNRVEGEGGVPLLPPPPALVAASSAAPQGSVVMLSGPGKMNPFQFHNNINKLVNSGNIPVVMIQPNVISNVG